MPKLDLERWVVLGMNSSQQAQIFGMFLKQETAEEWARKMERKKPAIQFLAMPITPRRDLERWLAEHDWRDDPNTADLED
jgi:hypothetical protein